MDGSALRTRSNPTSRLLTREASGPNVEAGFWLPGRRFVSGLPRTRWGSSDGAACAFGDGLAGYSGGTAQACWTCFPLSPRDGGTSTTAAIWQQPPSDASGRGRVGGWPRQRHGDTGGWEAPPGSGHGC